MTNPNGRERFWTVPNVISVGRLLGMAPLLWAAHQGHRQLFLWILLALLLSDWIDGKLGTLLDQKTVLGARLDSAADAVMYAALGVSFWWLEAEDVREVAGWFGAVFVTYGLSGVVALVRFGRMPSYHTLAAKASWAIAGLASVIWVLTGDAATVPWALAVVTLTNLEATAIGLVLPTWRANVPTAVHAFRYRRASEPDEGGA